MVFALVVPAVLIGGALLSPGRSILRERGVIMLLRICLAIGIGIGLSSYAVFIARIIGPGQSALLLLAMCALVGVAVYTAGAVRAIGPNIGIEGDTTRSPWIRQVLITTLLITLGAATVATISMSLTAPHGAWDAWAIWNLHARFLIAGGARWSDLFRISASFHPDYPLLVPGIVATLWEATGHTTTIAAVFVSMLFMFVTAGLLFAALATLRGVLQGLIATTLLLGTSTFVYNGAAQMADLPLAFYILATTVLLSLHFVASGDDRRPLFLAGMTAACAAWTKNEGLLFVLVTSVVFFGVTVFAWKPRYVRRSILPFVIGMLPGMLIVIYFKTQLAPVNDIMSTPAIPSIIERLTTFSRYTRVLAGFIEWSVKFGRGAWFILGIYSVLVGVTPASRKNVNIPLISSIVGFMLVGYFFTYIITPYELAWHINSSLERLLLHLWPAMLFLVFMMLRSPEQVLAHA